MTERTFKNIRICCYVALLFCFIWAFDFASIMFGDFTSYHPIDWSVNTVVRIIILVCYLLGVVAMIGMCIKAVFNTLKGLRENIVFPRSNEKLMFWIALADFVYHLGAENFHILWKDDVILQLQHTNFITPFFLLFFAFMYKVAADAVEENNLTI